VTRGIIPMEGDTFEALFWAMCFHVGFHMRIANSHKYLALTRRFGGTISTRAGPSAPHMTKTMIFGVLIKALGFVIEAPRTRPHLPSESCEKSNQTSSPVKTQQQTWAVNGLRMLSIQAAISTPAAFWSSLRVCGIQRNDYFFSSRTFWEALIHKFWIDLCLVP
jgi:hypothetical protein